MAGRDPHFVPLFPRPAHPKGGPKEQPTFIPFFDVPLLAGKFTDQLIHDKENHENQILS